MKNKLAFVYIGIAVSMLGMVLFQIGHVVDSYNQRLKSIEAGATFSLSYSVDKYRVENRNLIESQLFSLFSSLYDQAFIKTTINDSIIITLKEKTDVASTTNVSFTRGRVKVLFPSREKIGNEIVYKSNDIKAKTIIDSLFPLKPRDCMPVYYLLDSAKISNYFQATLPTFSDVRGFSNPSEFKLIFSCSTNPPTVYRPTTKLTRYAYSSHNLFNYGASNIRTVLVDPQSMSNIAIKEIVRDIILSVVLLSITIWTYIYLFVIIFKQKRLAEMKDDFINNMTHELKTPIAIISAAVEGMQNFNALQDKEKTNRYLETSRKELNRLNDLVTKVLHMASYEKKDIQLSLEKIEVDELMNDIIESFKNHSDKPLNITYRNASSVKYLEADSVHFRNAFSNLIDNAIKYSGEHVDIEINCFTENKYVKFSIRDRGIGIPPSQLSQIFEKFHRVPTGNIHNVKGTGLGLSYVKYIIEKHGGSVSVKSELNKGSEFTISVPSNS